MSDKWIELGLAAVVAILAYFFKRELGRIDDKASKADVTAALSRLDSHISECREQNKAVADTLMHVSNAVARIEGRLEQ